MFFGGSSGVKNRGSPTGDIYSQTAKQVIFTAQRTLFGIPEEFSIRSGEWLIFMVSTSSILVSTKLARIHSRKGLSWISDPLWLVLKGTPTEHLPGFRTSWLINRGIPLLVGAHGFYRGTHPIYRMDLFIRGAQGFGSLLCEFPSLR